MHMPGPHHFMFSKSGTNIFYYRVGSTSGPFIILTLAFLNYFLRFLSKPGVVEHINELWLVCVQF